ncbi:MAG: carboxypeptidase-like regulatory domain-containing protein [Gemmatimonadota bacterium]
MVTTRGLVGATVALIAIAVSPLMLSAQRIQGTIRDSASVRPISGAVVALLDSLGNTLARGTTDDRGQYTLVATPEARQLRVVRIGFRPQLTTIPRGLRADVSLVPIPFLLAEQRVIAASNCPSRGDRAAALSLLEHVRAGLLATVVARSQNTANMTRLLFERRMEGSGDRVVSQAVRRRSGTANATPFGAARNAASFVREGFREDSVGAQTFYGPDAETLIDEDFARGYCFHVKDADGARPHQVGLGFAATEHRNGRIDIAGALWVDTLARALRELDFSYVGLDSRTSALRPGGEVVFGELPNGMALAVRWSLRLVSGRQEAGGMMLTNSGAVSGGRTSRLYVNEIGGELARVAWLDGRTWTAPLGTFRLRARTKRGKPAAGALVQLEGTDSQGVADSTGLVTIGELLPGPYAIFIVDPRLSALDLLLSSSSKATATRDSVTDATLDVESAEDFVADRCERDQRITGGAWILGRVVARDGKPVGEARWVINDEFGSRLVEGGRVGGDGLFHWCQLPLDKRVEIEAWLGDRRVKANRVLAENLTIIRLELPM